MNFVRTTLNSNMLINIINLPEELKNQEVEVIILPLIEKDVTLQNTNIEKLEGALSKYKNQNLIKYESTIWNKVVKQKYGNSWC